MVNLLSNLAQYSTYSTDYGTSTASGAVPAALLVFYAVLFVFMVVIMWKLFVKAGRPGWVALVPVYNLWVLCEISGKPGWWALLAVVPFVNIIWVVLGLLQSLSLAEKFGKSQLFGVFGLWLFGIVGYPMLAFGNSAYQDAAVQAGPVPQGPSAPQGPVVQ